MFNPYCGLLSPVFSTILMVMMNYQPFVRIMSSGTHQFDTERNHLVQMWKPWPWTSLSLDHHLISVREPIKVVGSKLRMVRWINTKEEHVGDQGGNRCSNLVLQWGPHKWSFWIVGKASSLVLGWWFWLSIIYVLFLNFLLSLSLL